MRYIDADELIGFFDSYPDHIEFDVEDIKSIINEQDTADVVEVVRCKDCKWWKPFNDNMGHCGCDMKHKDQYCNYGERADT